MTLTELKQQVIKIASGDAPDETPTVVFSRLGFDIHHTGGGCMSLAVFHADGSHLLITDKDCNGIPDTMSDVMVGEYDSEGEPVGDVWEVA